MTDKPECGELQAEVDLERRESSMLRQVRGVLRAELDGKYVVDVSMLSERHVRALDFFVKKFVAGAIAHGDLQPGKKWTKDKLEERVDGAFYDIFDLLEALDAKEL